MIVTCKHRGCDREARERGYCWGHSWRAKHGQPMDPPIRTRTLVRYRPDAQCSVAGCGRKPETRGMCAMHYQRFRKHGSPTHERVPALNLCDCGKARSRTSRQCFACSVAARPRKKTKVCRKCGKRKHRSSFYAIGRPHCIRCELNLNHERYEANIKLAEALLIQELTGRLPIRAKDVRFLKHLARYQEKDEWRNAKARLRAAKRLLKDQDRFQSLAKAYARAGSSKS